MVYAGAALFKSIELSWFMPAEDLTDNLILLPFVPVLHQYKCSPVVSSIIPDLPKCGKWIRPRNHGSDWQKKERGWRWGNLTLVLASITFWMKFGLKCIILARGKMQAKTPCFINEACDKQEEKMWIIFSVYLETQHKHHCIPWLFCTLQLMWAQLVRFKLSIERTVKHVVFLSRPHGWFGYFAFIWSCFCYFGMFLFQ